MGEFDYYETRIDELLCAWRDLSRGDDAPMTFAETEA